MRSVEYYVDGMARYDYTIIADVQGLADNRPSLCTLVLRAFLEHGLLRDDPNLAWLAVELLYRVDATAASDWLLSGWEQFPQVTRLNIASATANPSAVPTEVALELFDAVRLRLERNIGCLLGWRRAVPRGNVETRWPRGLIVSGITTILYKRRFWTPS